MGGRARWGGGLGGGGGLSGGRPQLTFSIDMLLAYIVGNEQYGSCLLNTLASSPWTDSTRALRSFIRLRPLYVYHLST